ncbi:MAG: DNA mismatch repair protein MutS [Thermodesulfobacteriota bacterium]
MSFRSILFERAEDGTREQPIVAPPFFVDLNLDQIIDAITAPRQEYNLKPYYYLPLNDADEINYRQEIAQDLENDDLWDGVTSFSTKMSTMRRYLALIDNLYYRYHKQGWFVEAVEIYCRAVTGLARDLDLAHLRSRGFLSFREYIRSYKNSQGFAALLADTKKLKDDLATIRYCVHIKDNAVRVRRYESEIDYSLDVEKTFAKFGQGKKESPARHPIRAGMNHVEAQVLELVAKLFPDIFRALDDYCAKYQGYVDETIAVFDRQIQFYVAYLEYAAKLKQVGLRFCYPEVSPTDKEVYDYEGFDLALAHRLVREKLPVVSNDFELKDKERIIVVSGPNQGGKTTFARTFGQLHYLASLGCPVPGRKARLFLFDQIFTHFEREEDIKNQRGKLQDDLVRIYEILKEATARSIIIINEIFSSTTFRDAVFLGTEILRRIIQLDSLGICVTFIDELASLGDQTVSMVSTVVPENPMMRTFKIVRRPADGLSYAISIAEKYYLTYDRLRERIKS